MLLTTITAGLPIFLAYLVYGLTGFGPSIVAVPLLVLTLPVKVAVPLILLMDLVAGIFVGVRNKHHVAKKELQILLMWMAVGMFIGVVVLVNAPEHFLLILLGAFALFQSVRNLFFQINPEPISQKWAALYGPIGGIFTALFGTGGPIYVVYLSRRITEEAARRATMATLIWFSSFARLALFFAAGLMLAPELWQLAALCLPFCLVGAYAGSRIRRKLSLHHLNKIIWIVIGIAGITLLARHLP